MEMNPGKEKGLAVRYPAIRNLVLGCMLALGVLTTTGCGLFVVAAAAGAGAAGAAYVMGALQANVPQAPGAVEKAAVKAFEDLGIHTISSNSTALDAQVIGRTATDEKVTVTARVAETGGTALTIRVGAFGNETMSRRIYEEIKKQLN